MVTHHRGMVGSAPPRPMEEFADTNLVSPAPVELNLRDQPAVHVSLAQETPMSCASARPRSAASRPFTFRADFLYRRPMIAASPIRGLNTAGVQRLM